MLCYVPSYHVFVFRHLAFSPLAICTVSIQSSASNHNARKFLRDCAYESPVIFLTSSSASLTLPSADIPTSIFEYAFENKITISDVYITLYIIHFLELQAGPCRRCRPQYNSKKKIVIAIRFLFVVTSQRLFNSASPPIPQSAHPATLSFSRHPIPFFLLLCAADILPPLAQRCYLYFWTPSQTHNRAKIRNLRTRGVTSDALEELLR
ncbi:hypothetical protein C8R43DRAFT_589088 [Mycena crocata]|nr:hypothetical protein C8R43DRAFT_589088 [Mycena crocata]